MQEVAESSVIEPTEQEYTEMQAAAERFKTVASDTLNQSKERAKEIHVTVEDYVRQHPTKCVASALGVGLLLGLIIRR